MSDMSVKQALAEMTKLVMMFKAMTKIEEALKASADHDYLTEKNEGVIDGMHKHIAELRDEVRKAKDLDAKSREIRERETSNYEQDVRRRMAVAKEAMLAENAELNKNHVKLIGVRKEEIARLEEWENEIKTRIKDLEQKHNDVHNSCQSLLKQVGVDNG